MEKDYEALHVAKIPKTYKGKTYETYLIRHSYREGGKVKHRNIANITHLPPNVRELIRRALGGEKFFSADDAFEVVRSLPHGHVELVLNAVRKLELENLIYSKRTRNRELVTAMIVQRIIDPSSELATSRLWHDSSLASELGVEDADEDELYKAMDWLLGRQTSIEKGLAKRHLSEGGLALYDLTAAHVEGNCCPLAKFGNIKNGKKGKKQIEFGLLTDADGRPISVQVFPGNTQDTKTLAEQMQKLQGDFGLERIVIVGDRGMVTQTRINELRELNGVSWITALRSSSIRKLMEGGAIQMSIFDENNIAEITHPDYPGERLVVCRNPMLALKRAKTREELLASTEKKLVGIKNSVDKGRLKDKARIGVALGKVINKYRVGKHFKLTIDDRKFEFERDKARIDREAALDGLYIIRTNVPKAELERDDVVRSYKSLCDVERAFRTIKTISLYVRPFFHRLPDRVRAHIFICVLAYYVEWHIRNLLKPLLFDDEELPATKRSRDPVAQAKPSESARLKTRKKMTDDGLPLHSFATLLVHLGTQCKNLVRLKLIEEGTFWQLTTPTPIQKRVLELTRISHKYSCKKSPFLVYLTES